MPCQCISRIHAAMLSTGAAKVDGKMIKTSLDVFLYRKINNIKYRVQKVLYACLTFEVFHHGFITTVQGFILFMSSGIVNTATIKYKSSTMNTVIFRYAFAIREGTN